MLEIPSSSIDPSYPLRGNRRYRDRDPVRLDPVRSESGLLRFPELLSGSSSSPLRVQLRPLPSTPVGFLPPIESASFGSQRRYVQRPANGESTFTTSTSAKLRNNRESLDINAKNNLLLRPLDNLKSVSKEAEDRYTAANSSFDLGMTAPLFSVRPCPRYEKPIVSATLPSRSSLEALFPNVHGLLKPDLKKKPKSTTICKSPRKSGNASTLATVERKQLLSTTSDVGNRSRGISSSASEQKQSTRSGFNYEIDHSNLNSKSREVKKKRGCSGKRSKDSRPTSRKSAKNKRNTKTIENDLVNIKTTSFLDRTVKTEKKIGSFHKNLSDRVDTSIEDYGRKLGGNSRRDGKTSVVALLSKKLSNLSLYTRLNGDKGQNESKAPNDLNHSFQRGSQQERPRDNSSKGSKAPSKFDFTVVGNKGKVEEKSSPPQTQRQPVIMGKFISSCPFRVNDINDNSNTDNSDGSYLTSTTSSSTSSSKTLNGSFASDGAKAKKDFEAAVATPKVKRTPAALAKKEDAKDGSRNVKIYLSNKQTSDVRMEGGVMFPGAPPATPKENYARFVDFVPPLSDIRSQRQLKGMLEGMEQKQKAKAERLELAAKDADTERRKEAAIRLKAAQRREIYELNRLMEEQENKNFIQFCHMKGIEVEL